MKKKLIYNIKIICLCLFVFSLGIEYWDPFGIRHVFTVTKFAGFSYALFSFIGAKNNFAITKYNKQFIYNIILLWFWLTLISLVNTGLKGGGLHLFMGVLQAIILFWLVFNDVQNNPIIKKYIFYSFIIGIVFVSTLLSFGIGVENRIGESSSDIDNISRLYFMGMNPNRMGDLAAIAILMVFSLIFSNNNNKLRYLLFLTLPSLLTIIGFSGSRGSFVVVFLGLSVFFLLKRTKVYNKVIFLIIGFISSVFMIKYLSEFSVLQERLFRSYETGDTGSRIELWTHVFSIIQENLFFGTGKSGYEFKMNQISGSPKDPHNIFLYVGAVGGIAGLVLLLQFYLNVLKNSLINLKLNQD